MSGKQKNFYLCVNGHIVPVSEEVYRAYKHYARKERYFTYDLKVEGFTCDHEKQTAAFIPSREDSLDRLLEEDQQFASEEDTPEETAIKVDLLERLQDALQTLTDDELKLVHELFYLEMTEREAASAFGVALSTLHNRKKNVLKKLRELLN